MVALLLVAQGLLDLREDVVIAAVQVRDRLAALLDELAVGIEARVVDGGVGVLGAAQFGCLVLAFEPGAEQQRCRLVARDRSPSRTYNRRPFAEPYSAWKIACWVGAPRRNSCYGTGSSPPIW